MEQHPAHAPIVDKCSERGAYGTHLGRICDPTGTHL